MKSLNRPNQRFKWWIKVSFHRWSLFFIRSWWTKCETSMRVYKWGSPACEISQSSAFMFRAEQHLSVQSQLSSLNRLCHREMSRVFCHLLLFTTKDSSVHLVIEEDLLHRLKKKKKAGKTVRIDLVKLEREEVLTTVIDLLHHQRWSYSTFSSTESLGVI